MAKPALQSKRQRKNLSEKSLEQQGRGASTPGWLSNTSRRRTAGTPASEDVSNASSKENKAPAGRGRPAAKKQTGPAEGDGEAEADGARAAKPSGRRTKSAGGAQKAIHADDTPKPAKAGRKSAPAKPNIARKKQAAQPAAASPAVSAGSTGRKQAARSQKAASPAGQAAAEDGAQPASSAAAGAAKDSPASRTRGVRKRRQSDAAQAMAGTAQKRRRTEPDRPADRAAPQPAGDTLVPHCPRVPSSHKFAKTCSIGHFACGQTDVADITGCEWRQSTAVLLSRSVLLSRHAGLIVTEQPVAASPAAAAPADAAREAAGAAPEAPLPPQQQQQRRSSGRTRQAGSAGGRQDGVQPTRQPAAQPAAQEAPPAARSAEQSAGGSGDGDASRQDPAASTPGSDLARRVDANLQALQVRFPKNFVLAHFWL